MDSIDLPFCWCCETRFNSSDPPGPAPREDHHVIPRKAGGTDGPVVSICDEHHTKLHKIALRLKAGKPFFDLQVGDSDECKRKVLWLAVRVKDAFAAMEGDPNKQVTVALTFGSKEKVMIDRLKKVYGLKSREAVMNLALEALYKKHFIK